ncbi:hypothetical protein AAVH_22368 [Aphelenchoides avenae]|nr:hypothetical protein AAVH_22368 [Aphelenchus avenae]
MPSPIQYENLDPMPAAQGADEGPPGTPATVLEAFGPPSEEKTTDLQSMATALMTNPRTDLRSREGDAAVENRPFVAREVAKKKSKKKPSSFSTSDESREKKGEVYASGPPFTISLAPKKKVEKLLISETNTVDSQEGEDIPRTRDVPRNYKRIVCISVSAVFLVIFLVGAAISSAAIGFNWWTM